MTEAAIPARASAWVVHCDGSAMPNPGRMGLGAVLIAPDGTRHTLSMATHRVGCNNEAEVKALTLAPQDARARGATAVRAFSDNSIVVAQLGTADALPIARLAPLFDEARALLAGFDDARIEWIPRRRNAEADALARAALGMPPKAAPKPWKKRR